ncbi:MAG TPA: LTA synthase family protein [Rudaea sp.]|nr:LTA synthase family protein [Rudaea sp.]
MSRIRFRFPWVIAAALLTLLLSALRAIYLDDYAGAYTSCHGCFLLPTLGHDAWLIAGIFVTLALAMVAPWRWFRFGLRLLAIALIAAQAIDLALLRLLTQRLYFADLLRFSGDTAAAWSVVRAQLFSANGTWYLAITLATVVVLLGLLVDARRSRKLAVALTVCALSLCAFAAITLREPLRYVAEQYVWNVLGANLPSGRAKPFSPQFAQREQRIAQKLPRTCTRGEAQGRNIIIVITESLSAYQSRLLGGPHDWLPRLDAIAKANHYFTHFYANGFTTDGGEAAIFTGRPPLIPPGRDWYSLDAFGPSPDTLPAIAHRAGYAIEHFTTGSLNFLNKGSWEKSLNFDVLEGSEATYYKGMPRGQFGAAPDRALFQRYEQWLDHRQDTRPFLSVLLTVSSHPPFVDPRTGKIDPARAFGYVDDQIADFHAALNQRGFFANGILLITGDHHAMTPILPAEYARFGERAFARIPLIVAGAVDMPKVVDAAFQQSDFPASLAYVMGVEYCRTAFNGIFLAPNPAPPTYVVQARGDNRNRVDVYFDDSVASYLQDGDASTWLGSQRPPQADEVEAWINTQRLRNAVLPAAN